MYIVGLLYNVYGVHVLYCTVLYCTVYCCTVRAK